MSLVKYPRCEGTELKVYDMELFGAVNLLLVIGFGIKMLIDVAEQKEHEKQLVVRKENLMKRFLWQAEQLRAKGIYIEFSEEPMDDEEFKTLMGTAQ